ncbi:F0F1 ATP synthase subunit delta [Salinibacterium sp. SYSU T00001]|uniref:F0F1 ATP synthase subunit delta n=1 Tax=Homoserinimonas sedimenticola TaxID=2986805 RepID=UPI0022360F9A|nr:F0F1 ATP synthase subunit delta [Salinibacterium sedimenticola]MCW4386665.1 F0F1 ATP synthase subunit delta [Salinibacterium sedimenticola]
MGSATREATAASRAALDAAGASVNLGLAEELFAAGRTIGSSLQLRTLLSEAAGDKESKRAAVRAVFGSSLTPTALTLLEAVVSGRWSSVDDMLAGIEDLGLRAVAASAPQGADLEGELFSFGATVTSNAELELALGSKLGDSAAKAALVDRLFTATMSREALAVVRHLVQQPRGRRVGQLVRDAARTIADASGYIIATVTAAAPPTESQSSKLRQTLAARYGREIKLNVVLDPALIGGLRVAIGNDIIDGSVATRIADLRLQLAG